MDIAREKSRGTNTSSLERYTRKLRMKEKRNLFHRRKQGKGGGVSEEDGTRSDFIDSVITTDVAEKKHDLYATDGSIGMRVVVDPADALLDIVFVHGLTGNRDMTWTHKSGVFWPKELAKDIKTARIMTFGYDADVVKLWGMAGGGNLRNHGKNLAIAVSNQRRNSRVRPVIFIAHSLGGLVCEQALLYCGEGDRNLDKLFKSTRGVIFMGTPHAGSDLADWGYTLAKYLNVVRRTNSSLLDPLRQKSDVLTAVQQQFQKLLLKPGVSVYIYCFFEEKAVTGVGTIVPKHSAVLSQYPNQSIAANHMDMTRFSGRSDEGYQRVLYRVKENIELINSLATTEINQRPLVQYSQSQRELANCESRTRRAAELDVKQSQAVSSTAAGPVTGIGRDMHGSIYMHYPTQEDNKSECHRLFRTSQYERQKDKNAEAVKGTCRWFLGHPNYLNWLNSHTSHLLWVSGDPWCGKSVLSRLLVDKELQGTQSRTTCYFFFKGDNECQSTVGDALCAILHQLFDRKPELLPHAVEVFDRNGQYFKENVDLLWNTLIKASDDPKAGEVICVLDAIDECRISEAKDLLQKLCSFYSGQPCYSQYLNLKFLVTSRPVQHIEDIFDDIRRQTPSIHLAGEDETDQIRREIDFVIEYKLTEIRGKWLLGQKAIDALREELVRFEHRTYLWLKLIFDLIDQDIQSVTKRGRRRIFGSMPDSVDAAYTAILNKCTDMGQARKVLQIVCVAARPLSIKEMSIAISIEAEDKSFEDLEVQPEGFSKRLIRNICGLFVSVIDGHVYLLHESAKEFLIAQGDIIQPTSGLAYDRIWKHSISIQDSNVLLAHICIWFLRLEEFHMRRPIFGRKEIDQLVFDYDFLEYSALNWASHLRVSIIPGGHPLLELGLELCNRQADHYMSWEPIYWYKAMYRDPPAKFKNIHIASHLGLVKVVGQLLAAPGVNVNMTDRNNRTPLWWAAYEGHQDIVTRLLAVPGIYIDIADNTSQTPLSIAQSRGYNGIVKLLENR